MRTPRAGIALILMSVVLAGCSGGGGASSAQPSPSGGGFASTAGVAPNKFACLDFLVQVTSGPNAGKTIGGDLILTTDSSGGFVGNLVKAGDADRNTLTIRQGSEVLCTATGQVNGSQVSWILHCKDGSRVFGTGVVDTLAQSQELRGVTTGPDDRDFGIYHGRNYPPFIRIISPSDR